MVHSNKETSSRDVAEYLVAGCGAAVVSRTFIAPIERVKIIFQTAKKSQLDGWLSIAPRIWKEEGLLAFWRGNGVAVVRVMPYLSVQLAGNDLFRQMFDQMSLTSSLRNLFAGTCAGTTAVLATYPLDTVRARLAMHAKEGRHHEGMSQVLRKVWVQEGASALYRGCWMTAIGGGVYAGLKFMTYDMMKAQFHKFYGVTSDKDLHVWHRALSGAVGGAIAQTIAYPFDVMRRRMQTTTGASPYNGVIDGLTTIAREEGVRAGLYRGLSLNYFKTIPNVAIYLSLYDVLKYWLIQLRL